MHVAAHHPEDLVELARRIARESDAEQRDRYRAVLLALEGQETQEIQKTLARSRDFVQTWVYAYRDGGVAAIRPKPRGGSAPRLATAEQARFIARMQAGPTAADGGICRLGGKQAQRILAQEFGVAYSLSAIYELLHRHGLVCLRPRPRHRYHDPAAQQAWAERAPLLPSRCSRRIRSRRSRSGSRTKRGSASRAR